MNRTAHYVASTHWDREWYEPFQGLRMRLVSMLDEVFETMERDPDFRAFVMDGQTIPALDYLEIRPEMEETVRRFVRERRFCLGPWYVLPDEWLVSGESLVRNLETGMERAVELGGSSSRAGFVCDMFGHTGQLPQIFAQMGIPVAFIWRGTHEREHHGLLRWKAPDGTVIPAYRFGPDGYCTYAFRVRRAMELDTQLEFEDAVGRLVTYTLSEAERTPEGPILLFDGGDHMEIEPRTSVLIACANERLAPHGIAIVHSDLDRYMDDLLRARPRIETTLCGELRETGRDPLSEDQQWLIPGVLSSRIHLKQMNTACEDELCLWAEPFTAFAARLGVEYPRGFLRAAWRHLLENHPHDSMCGCSPDQVHRDMLYRFDQSLGISGRLAGHALREITAASAPADFPEGALLIGVFNPTARELAEPVDLDIPLPADWPATFQEFLGYELKPSFRLRGPAGEEIPWQLDGQIAESHTFRRPRYKFPAEVIRRVARVTAPLRVPAFGYTTLTVEPEPGPIRHPGSLALSDNAIGNEYLRVEVAPNGTVTLADLRTGRRFERLLAFEERADIGDGWYHGLAVNDRVHTSAACGADVALVADGFGKATLRVALAMRVPEAFDFQRMVRSDATVPLPIVADITLRTGCPRVEVAVAVENTALDHRLRVLLPTGLSGDTYLSDAAFDVVERAVALAPDNALRRELDVETRPQATWTAFGDGDHGLAVVSRGLPESAVRATADRAIALTLLRGFRKAVFADDNPGGQVAGTHRFRFDIVPFSGPPPVGDLFILGQRVNGNVRTVVLTPRDLNEFPAGGRLPRVHSFFTVRGNVVVTSVRECEGRFCARFFNPGNGEETVVLRPAFDAGTPKCVTLGGGDDPVCRVDLMESIASVTVPPRRIATVMWGR
jgi:alpha-mannosidase/mannosylglycerate hydrolase